MERRRHYIQLWVVGSSPATSFSHHKSTLFGVSMGPIDFSPVVWLARVGIIAILLAVPAALWLIYYVATHLYWS